MVGTLSTEEISAFHNETHLIFCGQYLHEYLGRYLIHHCPDVRGQGSRCPSSVHETLPEERAYRSDDVPLVRKDLVYHIISGIRIDETAKNEPNSVFIHRHPDLFETNLALYAVLEFSFAFR